MWYLYCFGKAIFILYSKVVVFIIVFYCISPYPKPTQVRR